MKREDALAGALSFCYNNHRRAKSIENSIDFVANP